MVDNCCSLRAKLKDIFVENPVIKLDLFQFIQTIILHIPKRQANAALRNTRREMIKELRLCFRAHDYISQNRKSLHHLRNYRKQLYQFSEEMAKKKY